MFANYNLTLNIGYMETWWYTRKPTTIYSRNGETQQSSFDEDMNLQQKIVALTKKQGYEMRFFSRTILEFCEMYTQVVQLIKEEKTVREGVASMTVYAPYAKNNTSPTFFVQVDKNECFILQAFMNVCLEKRQDDTIISMSNCIGVTPFLAYGCGSYIELTYVLKEISYISSDREWQFFKRTSHLIGDECLSTFQKECNEQLSKINDTFNGVYDENRVLFINQKTIIILYNITYIQMGAWGDLDDANDNVGDGMIDIYKKVLPNTMFDSEGMNGREKYMMSNKNKVYKALLSIIKENKNNWGDDIDNYLSFKVGMTLAVIKDLNNKQSILLPHAMSKKEYKEIYQLKIPKDFPKDLLDDIINDIKTLYIRTDLNKQGWVNLEERKNALRIEYHFFTQTICEALNDCAKGKRKSKKDTKKSSKRLTKNSKRTSIKKSTRRSKKSKRQGPSISANSVKVGTVKTGNDGNKWKVKKYTTKYGHTQRWIKI